MSTSSDLLAPNWQRLTFDGYFSFELPSGTVVRLEDEDTILVVSLEGRSGEMVEIVLGAIYTQNNAPISPQLLRSEVERFMVNSAHAKTPTFSAPLDFQKLGFLACQAVAQIDEDHCWIARVYGRMADKRLLLVHCHGLETDLREVVFPILVTIDPTLEDEVAAVY